MPTPQDQIADAVRRAIADVAGLHDADPLVQPSQNPAFGDYQSNAAMGLAKRLGQKPRDLAERLKAALPLDDLASEVSVAGPGFLNIRLARSFIARAAAGAAADARLGVPTDPNPETVVVEYSSPNVAKQMHVGHLRSTILGDVAARVLDVLGHRVIRQNHIGDWGTQFGMLIRHLDDRPGATAPDAPDVPDALHARYADLEEFYRAAKTRFDEDPAFADEARAAVVRLQSGDPDARAAWGRIVEQSRGHFLPLYQRLGVRLTRKDERGESAYNDRLSPLVDELLAAGVATVSEGATVVFTPPDKAPLMVRKSDGGFGYGTTDLAALEYRVHALGATRLLYFVDFRQSQHFRQVFAAARLAGLAGEGVRLEHASFGSVLGEDGKPFKTRAGATVKLADLLDESVERAHAVVTQKNPDLDADARRRIGQAVGIGAVKYADLVRDRTSDYVFSFDDMLRLDGNTGPYLQYAHARVCSILRKADAVVSQFVEPSVDDPHEAALAGHLLRFADVVQAVGRELKPHLLCAYLYDAAGLFSRFYENCPVLKAEHAATRAGRLALCALFGRTLACGLDLLGIEHPQQM